MLAYVTQHPLELRQIPGAETGSPALVPGNRLEMLRFGLGMESRTSSKAALGPSAKSAPPPLSSKRRTFVRRQIQCRVLQSFAFHHRLLCLGATYEGSRSTPLPPTIPSLRVMEDPTRSGVSSRRSGPGYGARSTCPQLRPERVYRRRKGSRRGPGAVRGCGWRACRLRRRRRRGRAESEVVPIHCLGELRLNGIVPCDRAISPACTENPASMRVSTGVDPSPRRTVDIQSA